MSLLVLAMTLGLIFFIFEVSIGRARTLQSVLCLSFVVVCIGWVGIRNPLILWSIRALLIAFLVTVVYNFQPKRHLIVSIYKSVYLFLLGLISTIIPQKLIFFLFAAGYDNSSHLGFLFRTWKIGSYEYGLQGNGKFVPTYSNLANAYPSLQMESWAFILHVLNLSINSSEALLRYFFFFSILSIMLLLYILFSFIPFSTKQNLFLKLAIFGLVFCSSISVIFWMGFPPTVWGIIFALLGLKVVISTNNRPNLQLVIASISFVVVLYSYQLFAPAYLGIYLYLFFEIVRFSRNKKDYLSVFGSVLFLLVPSILLFRVSGHIKSNSFVYAQGGIIMPSLSLIAVLVILAYLTFLYSDKKSKENRIIIGAIIINSTLTFYLLGSGTLLNKGIYYPIKSLYLTLFLLISYLIWCAREESTLINNSFGKLNRAIVIIFLVFSCLPLVSQNKGVWYGNSVDIVRSIKSVNSGSYAPFPPNCLEDVFYFATKGKNFDKQTNLIVVKVDYNLSDLVSRWANSLNGRVDENIIALGMSLNASSDFNSAVSNFRKSHLLENIIVQDSLTSCTKA